jgi:hypothetical protein
MEEARKIAGWHRGPVWVGGPAVQLLGKPEWADEAPKAIDDDVLARHNPDATFTTRGCVRRCKFCCVPRIEGGLIQIPDFTPKPIVCDNNFLAASRKHIEMAIGRLSSLPYVDFNQGLDARIFTQWHAQQLRRLRHVKVRFAFDHRRCEPWVQSAFAMARAEGLVDFGCYVLIGFEDSPADARYRLEKVREWDVRPTPMRYQPLDAKKKNAFVAHGWTERELLDMTQYYSNLRYNEHVPFESFDHSKACRDWSRRKRASKPMPLLDKCTA